MSELKSADAVVERSIDLSRRFLEKSGIASAARDEELASTYSSYERRAGAVITSAAQRQARYFNSDPTSQEKVAAVARQLMKDFF